MQAVVHAARYAGWSISEALAEDYDVVVHMQCLRNAEAMADDLYNQEYERWLKSQQPNR